MSKLLEKLMSDVKSRVKEISCQALINKIKSGDNIVILDVRSKPDWEKAHIPGAIHCERGMLELMIEKILEDTSVSIVTCCGGGTRSALCAESLSRMGYKNVESLAGGFRGWLDAKLPTETTN